MRAKDIRYLLIALLVATSWQFGQAAYLRSKAQVAQVLLQIAWFNTRIDGEHTRPWPWADTYPVGRMQVPRLEVDLFVLAGLSGRTLAFGPGHFGGSVKPGQTGNSLISAHRDTHFSFLQDLQTGDEIIYEHSDGSKSQFRVIASYVIHQDRQQIGLDTADRRLTLVTCYPFDGVLPNRPWRYVVESEWTGTFNPRIIDSMNQG